MKQRNPFISVEESQELSHKFRVTPDLPEYKNFTSGKWSLNLKKVPAIRGYFNGLVLLGFELPILDKGGDIWMSLTPMEVESHLVHAALAHGDVLVCGLGMGYIVYKMLQNPNVTSITVVECCSDLIELVDDMHEGDWMKDPRVTVVHGDALTYVPPHPITYLYVDIFLTLFEEDTVSTVQSIQRNVCADYVGFWGQELAYVMLSRDLGVLFDDIDYTVLLDADDTWDLPMGACSLLTRYTDVTPDEYVTLCQDAARNTRLM
jgi:hypothetical protein